MTSDNKYELSPESVELIGKLIEWKRTDIQDFYPEDSDPKYLTKLETIEKQLKLVAETDDEKTTKEIEQYEKIAIDRLIEANGWSEIVNDHLESDEKQILYDLYRKANISYGNDKPKYELL